MSALARPLKRPHGERSLCPRRRVSNHEAAAVTFGSFEEYFQAKWHFVAPGNQSGGLISAKKATAVAAIWP